MGVSRRSSQRFKRFRRAQVYAQSHSHEGSSSTNERRPRIHVPSLLFGFTLAAVPFIALVSVRVI